MHFRCYLCVYNDPCGFGNVVKHTFISLSDSGGYKTYNALLPQIKKNVGEILQ